MDEPRLRAKLIEVGFRLAVVDGARIVDDASFFEQIRPALGLPEFFGDNWDAYNDSLWGLCGSLAVLWRDCDRSFAGDAQTLFSAVMGLMDAGLEPARDPGQETFRLAVFLLGSGPGFRALES
jgi:RNAse (barnase) inhibitor barstar